jgi:ligand-binding sensor domain-containing protein/AraC-like DNA-binding protein
MYFWRNLFIFLALLWLATVRGAVVDKWNFQHLSANDILPTDKVHHISEGKNSVFWFATSSALCRYTDGKLTCYQKNMDTPNLLPDNDVICTAEGPRGFIWVGTQEGLCLLNPLKKLSTRYVIKGEEKQRVNDICVTSSGATFFATIRGLAKWDETLQRPVLVKEKAAPCNINLQSICELKDGRLLLASWEHGLYLYDVGRRSFIHIPQVNGVKRYMAVRSFANGEVWAGTYGSGAQKLSVSPKGKISAQTFFQGEYVGGLAYSVVDRHVWIATRKGILLDNGERMMKHCGEVRDIYCDHLGRLWISTIGEGIYLATIRHSLPIFTSLLKEQGSVSALAVIRDGCLWAAHNYGVTYLEDGKQTWLLHDKRIYGITRGRHSEEVWIAIHNGGVSLGRKGVIVRNYNQKNCHFVPHQDVRMAVEDSNGNLWVASYQGLGVRYANGKEVNFNQVKNAPLVLKQEILCLFVSHNHTLWLANKHSIIHIERNSPNPLKLRVRVYPITAKPIQIFEDRNNRLWIATDGNGLCRLEKDNFVSYNNKWQIPSETVSSICEDEDRNLWVGTTQGIVEVTACGKSYTYTTREGLPYNYLTPGTAVSCQGAVYMGCSQGLVKISAHLPEKSSVTKWIVMVGIIIVMAVFLFFWKGRRDKRKILTLNDDMKDRDREFIDKATCIVQAHLSDSDFTTQQLMSEMAISKTTLFNKLKLSTGKNATTFIRDIRLEEAHRLIDEEKNVRISEVAYRVGFNDPKYFSLCFKKYFGISPSAYLEIRENRT